ncbi:2OG-Fe(II) oxygenase [bacterium]|nr:2OG-Fe(II) oxygenase [bacterium]
MIKQTDPFDHWVIDDFIDLELANQLSNEFLDYNDINWFCYDNPLEQKKTINNWYLFPPSTYSFMSFLNSPKFVDNLCKLTGIENLIPDIGLHGAGWHIHGNQGKINLHYDYSIHPKLFLQRKLNVILYLSKEWDPKWGGNLEFWSHDEKQNKPKENVTTIEVKFNRAVIFDTTQNSWHGFPDPIKCPDKVYRKSIAMYYLCEPPIDVDQRKRALYAPTKDQKNNFDVLNLIKERSTWNPM